MRVARNLRFWHTETIDREIESFRGRLRRDAACAGTFIYVYRTTDPLLYAVTNDEGGLSDDLIATLGLMPYRMGVPVGVCAPAIVADGTRRYSVLQR